MSSWISPLGLGLALALASPLAAAPVPIQDGGIYLAQDGLVVVEVESTPTTGAWTEVSDGSGHTFQSYYRWDGPDHFNSPGNGVLGYRLLLDQPGDWRLSVHNRHDHPDSTLENDVWVRVDGGTWFKLYSNGSSTVGVWNWMSKFDIHGSSHPNAGWTLDSGEHLLEFSGRSNAFMIDRFHLYIEPNGNGKNESMPESLAILGESTCSPNEDNTTGRPAVIGATGSTFVEINRLTLGANGMPTYELGLFLASQTPAFVPGAGGSAGNLCLGGSIARWRKFVKSSGSSGSFELSVDVTQIPAAGTTSIQPGETWHFQAWYRDGARSNFTDAVAVTFQ